MQADPKATLKAQGIGLQPGAKLVLHEGTARLCHFVLPMHLDGELSWCNNAYLSSSVRLCSPSQLAVV